MTLSFDPTLYRRDALDAAAAAYAAYAAIEVAEDAGRLVARFEGVDADDVEALTDHFCNHVLFETVVRAREEAAT